MPCNQPELTAFGSRAQGSTSLLAHACVLSLWHIILSLAHEMYAPFFANFFHPLFSPVL